MKILIFLAFVYIADTGFSQDLNADINGYVFNGTATEVTSPDVDRMPVVFSETIRFDDGKVNSDILKIYSADNCDYTAITDERRMMAFKVVNVQFFTTGNIDGINVNIEFSGNIIGDKRLYGNMCVKYPDSREMNYTINAESQ